MFLSLVCGHHISNFGNFEMLSGLNGLDLCGLFKLIDKLTNTIIQLQEVCTSPTCLGVRAFQSCQGVSLCMFLPLVCGHLIRPGNFQMLSRLYEMDLCGLFLTEEWTISGCHSV